MESVELEEGWLARQMKDVRREVESWPDVLKPLTTINASLVHEPSPTEVQETQAACQQGSPQPRDR